MHWWFGKLPTEFYKLYNIYTSEQNDSASNILQVSYFLTIYWAI